MESLEKRKSIGSEPVKIVAPELERSFRSDSTIGRKYYVLREIGQGAQGKIFLACRLTRCLW